MMNNVTITKDYLGLNPSDRTTGAGKHKCPFPDCAHRASKGKKDLYINYDSRVFHCYHCGKMGSLDKYERNKEYALPKLHSEHLKQEGINLFRGRGISVDTCLKNKVGQVNRWSHEKNQKEDFVVFPYYDAQGKDVVTVKYRRIAGKEFGQEAGTMPTLMNVHLWKNEKEVIICEGEFDVLALNEAGYWNATTPSLGAINANDKEVDGKLQPFYNNFEYLDNKDKIILFCDSDEQGQRLQTEVAKKVGTFRCWVAAIPEGYKDPNEVLAGNKEKGLPALGVEGLQRCINEAKQIPLQGVMYAGEVLPVALAQFREGKPKGITTHYPDVDELFKWKFGNLNVWTGYANQGKTSVVLEMMLVMSLYHGWKWACFSPENYPAIDFFDDLAEMLTGKHVDDRAGRKMSEAEYEAAYLFLEAHFIYVYPEETQTLDNILGIFKQLIGKHGVNGCLIDPYNQLDSTQEGKRDDVHLSVELKKAKRFALEYDVILNIVVHPKTINNGNGAAWKVVEAYDIAQGAMWANKADDIVSIYAPFWHDDKSNTEREFHKQKTKRRRTGGQNGSCKLERVNDTNFKELRSNKQPCSMVAAMDWKELQAMNDNGLINGIGYGQSLMFEMPALDADLLPRKPDKSKLDFDDDFDDDNNRLF